MLYNFVWDRKCNKIKQKVLIKDYEEGGLKMTDVLNHNLNTKIMWIKKTTHFLW